LFTVFGNAAIAQNAIVKENNEPGSQFLCKLSTKTVGRKITVSGSKCRHGEDETSPIFINVTQQL
jgi:hypothetical protein